MIRAAVRRGGKTTCMGGIDERDCGRLQRACLPFGLRSFCVSRAGLHARPPLSARRTLTRNGALELVDPHVFRACADPRDLPFSNQAGEGFENKIADLLAKKLGKDRSPTPTIPTRPASSATRSTRSAATWSWASRSATTWCSRPIPIIAPPMSRPMQGRPAGGLDSLSDPRLKTAKIGVIAGTPPATYLAQQRPASDTSNPMRSSSTPASIRRTPR